MKQEIDPEHENFLRDLNEEREKHPICLGFTKGLKEIIEEGLKNIEDQLKMG